MLFSENDNKICLLAANLLLGYINTHVLFLTKFLKYLFFYRYFRYNDCREIGEKIFH